MVISELATFATRHLAVVRLTTSSGAVGWGQLAPVHADLSSAVFHRQVAPHALGQPVDDPAALGARILRAEYKFPGSYLCRALAGLDTALWDLRGRLAGQPVWALLGATARPLPVYGSSMRRDLTPAAEASRMLRLRDEAGFQAFKIRVGGRFSGGQDQWPGRTDELIPTVRQVLGDAVTLLADANSSYAPEQAIAVGRQLEDCGYHHFEEPCPFPELEQTAAVAAALDIAVAGGEQDCDLSQWQRMARLRAVDIMQPDICYLGGFSRALEVTELAAAHGLTVVPHSANPSLVFVAALHLMAAAPHAEPFVEYSIEECGWLRGVYDGVPVCRDGRVSLPTAPGWGISPRQEWLDTATVQVSRQE
ncbi:MAG: mandelate racemase/muconate lactonizing enzyme family protein [Fimbriimonadaceae bacterium]|nr:mandelate racemase/muconate lactonizing enzyme family protein [Fimbriimonadaceae bacterium]